MAARRRPAAAQGAAPVTVEVPPWLLAGACVELWCADGAEDIIALGRYSRARSRWLAEVGIDAQDYPAIPEPLRSGGLRGCPWRYSDQLAAGTLAERLAALGLPSDWTPSSSPPPPGWGQLHG